MPLDVRMLIYYLNDIRSGLQECHPLIVCKLLRLCEEMANLSCSIPLYNAEFIQLRAWIIAISSVVYTNILSERCALPINCLIRGIVFYIECQLLGL